MKPAKPVAILVHEGYQDLEFWYPLLRLREEGKPVTVIAAEPDKTYFSQLEYPVIADIGIAGAKGGDYAGVVVPGGQSAKFIAEEPRMQAFIRDAAVAGAEIDQVIAGVDEPQVEHGLHHVPRCRYVRHVGPLLRQRRVQRPQHAQRGPPAGADRRAHQSHPITLPRRRARRATPTVSGRCPRRA